MSRISVFKNVSEVKNPDIMDLFDYLEKTRDGYWEDLVTQCRLIKDKDERMAFKRKMPTATLSGVFNYRSDKDLDEHSGYISMDLDHVENLQNLKNRLCKDEYVFSCFMSTSGDGLRVLFKVDPKKHNEAFLGLKQYIFEKYGEVCDGASISKPYVVSYDPGLYLNFDEVPVFKKYIKETPIKKLDNFVHTASDFEMVVEQISARKIEIWNDYNDWLKVGFAIADQFGENGRAAFHKISQVGADYKYKFCDKQYDYCLKGKNSNTAKISTFYYLAKSHGISIVTEQTKKIVRYTTNGKKAGLSKTQIIENLLKHENISGADEVVGNVFDSNMSSDESEEESILFQLETFIQTNYSLRMNEVTGFLEQNGSSLSPGDLNTIFIAAKKVCPKLDYQLMMRLLKSDFVESYNPFFEFFGSDGIPVTLPAIPEEDTKVWESPLIDRLAATIKNDNPAYTHFFLRKWLVSIISSAHKVHSPLLLCLIGGQNTGKTEFFRRLLPQELRLYYAESKLDKEKDDDILMTENLVILDDEYGGKTKQDYIKFKNITSKQFFYLRRPYGEHNERILRLAVLCGTSNIKEILADHTGNRRVIPVEVTDIDKVEYNKIDKKELFMEAFRLYKAGFDWRVGTIDMQFLNKDQEKYESVIKEKELIVRYFRPGTEDSLTTTDIAVEIELITKQRLSLITLGRELEKCGFLKKSTRVDGVVAKRWGIERINRPQKPDAPMELYKPGDMYKKSETDEDAPF